MIIGIDIGGTKIRVGYSRLGDYIEDSIEFDTPTNQRRAAQMLIDTIHLLVGSTSIDGIGVASPGPINKARGTIINPHNLLWHNYRITLPLQNHFHCPVILEHDATAGGIAEARQGAGQGCPLVLYITISTGIGSSIIYNGNTLGQRHNSQGGDQIIGNESTKPLTYHETCSGKSINLIYQHPASEIKNSHTWNLIAKDMAVGIYNMIAIIQPDCVVLGGGVLVHYKHFVKPLHRWLSSYNSTYPLPPIKRARYVETAPLLGVMLLATEALDQ